MKHFSYLSFDFIHFSSRMGYGFWLGWGTNLIFLFRVVFWVVLRVIGSSYLPKTPSGPTNTFHMYLGKRLEKWVCYWSLRTFPFMRTCWIGKNWFVAWGTNRSCKGKFFARSICTVERTTFVLAYNGRLLQQNSRGKRRPNPFLTILAKAIRLGFEDNCCLKLKIRRVRVPSDPGQQRVVPSSTPRCSKIRVRRKWKNPIISSWLS